MSVSKLRKMIRDSERIAAEDLGVIKSHAGMAPADPTIATDDRKRGAFSPYVGPIWRFRDADGFTFSLRADVAIAACEGDEKLRERYLAPLATKVCAASRKAPAHETRTFCFGGNRYSVRFGAASCVRTSEPLAVDTTEPSEIAQAKAVDGWIDGTPIADLPALPMTGRVFVRLAGCVLTIGGCDFGESRQATTDNREIEAQFDAKALRSLASAVGARGAMVGLVRVNEALCAIVVHGARGVAVLGSLAP